MPYEKFDTSRLRLRPLQERESDYDRETLYVPPLTRAVSTPTVVELALRIQKARARDKPVIAFLGGHVIKQGCSQLINDLVKRKIITHVAGNGAVMIHDWELSLHGKTSESVERYIKTGEFGMWQETSGINDAITRNTMRFNCGIGEAVGRQITGHHPFYYESLVSTCYQQRVPLTIHPGIGYDIHHAHPNFDGVVFGGAATTDFLVFAHAISQLEGGVFLNIGSAVAGPEVYLKALSMARNVARQDGKEICHFTTGVFDIYPLGDRRTAPDKTQPAYYFRPLKTILDRTVADGGESFYIEGNHNVTIPSLHSCLVETQ